MRRGVAAAALGWAMVAACTPQPPPPTSRGTSAVIELLGGPESATDYSRDITAREVTLATGGVRSWSLGRDLGPRPLQPAAAQTPSPAAYLLGEYGVPDLGTYLFPKSGPQRISGAVSERPDMLAPDLTYFARDRQDLVQFNLTGAIVNRWPVPVPMPGDYVGPTGKSGPNGRTPYQTGLAFDSAGHPIVLVTNGVNSVLADLKTGRQAALPGLALVRDFEIRVSDGRGFAVATTYVRNMDANRCPFCAFNEVDSLIEFDIKSMQLTARYALPAPRGSLLMGRRTVDVILRQEATSTMLTLDEANGRFIEHSIPVGYDFLVASDWAGSVYLYEFHNYPGASAGQQDRMLVYDRATGKSSDAAGALRPPAGQEVLGILFRS